MMRRPAIVPLHSISTPPVKGKRYNSEGQSTGRGRAGADLCSAGPAIFRSDLWELTPGTLSQRERIMEVTEPEGRAQSGLDEGFTLLEMMVVVVLILLLATFAMPMFHTVMV